MNTPPPAENAPATGRARLIRDIATLQVKLLVDGFRDLLLVPTSLVIGVFALFGRGDQAGASFYDLLMLGKRSEKWINLFGAAERYEREAARDDGEDIDSMVQRVETFLVDEYRSGRISGQARDKLESTISRLQDAAKRRSGP